jgi:hypothetical protein
VTDLLIDGKAIWVATRGNELFRFEDGQFDEVPYNTITGMNPSALTTSTPSNPQYVFDLNGRQLNTKSSKGIYIQNGKKVVIK